MKVLLDTNIIVDVLSKRNGYEDSLRVLRCCEVKIIDGWVSTTTITDVMYILRRHASPELLRESMQTLLAVADIAGIRKVDITRAFSSGMSDFEDAVQAACAKRINADYIVTRNLRDFEGSFVQAVSPADLLKRLGYAV